MSDTERQDDAPTTETGTTQEPAAETEKGAERTENTGEGGASPQGDGAGV